MRVAIYLLAGNMTNAPRVFANYFVGTQQASYVFADLEGKGKRMM